MLSILFNFNFFLPSFWQDSTNFNLHFTLLIYIASSILLGYIVQQLQNSKQRYQGILEDQTELIYRFNADGTLSYVNTAFCRFFGQAPEKILGKTWHPKPIDEEGPNFKSYLAIVSPTNPVLSKEKRVINAEGEIRWYHFIYRAVYDDKQRLVEMQSVGRDITQQKQAEIKQQELFTNLTQTSQRLPCVIFQYQLHSDGRSSFPYANDTIKQLYRINPEDVKASAEPLFNLLHPEDQKLVLLSIKQSAKNLQAWQQDYRICFADGSIYNLYGKAIPERQADGSILWHGYMTDISARKQLETELYSKLRDFEDRYNLSPCGYHSLDSNGVFQRINDTELEWLGCNRNEVLGKLKITDFLTESSQDRFKLNFAKIIANGQLQNMEYDLVSRSGQIRHVIGSCAAIRDDQNQFVMTRSVLYDITKLKRIQNQLKIISAEQQAMLDNELIAILKYHPQKPVWINLAFKKLFGYDDNHLDEQVFSALFPNASVYQTFIEATNRVLIDKMVFRTQLELCKKNGQLIWVDISGMPLKSEHNETLWMLIDISALKKQQQEIEKLAYHDVLTGLPNRLLVADRLKQAVAQAERSKQLLAVCYLDLDGFKAINDQYGHAEGDKLLLEIARRMQTAIRANDTVGRIGGDEFILLLSNLENIDEYQIVLQRLIDEINKPIQISNAQVQVGASIGVTLYPTDNSEPDLLLRHSDQAMYQAKNQGRNRVCLY